MPAFTITGLAIVAMTVSVVQGPTWDAQTRQAIQQSCAYERGKDYPRAAASLMPQHNAHPEDYLLNLRLGWLGYLDGKYDESLRYYQAAAQTASESLEAKLGCLLPMLASAKYQEAEAVARQITKSDPRNYYGNLRLAMALRGERKHTNAREIVQQMLVTYPADMYFWEELAQLDSAQTSPDAATAAAADAQIRETVRRSCLGEGSHEYSGVTKSILDEYHARPHDYSLKWRLEWVNYLNEPGGAKVWLLTSDTQIREALRQSCACEANLDYSCAIRPIQQQHNAHPRNYTLNVRLGWLYYLIGDYRISSRYYYTAIKDVPQATEAGLGYLLPLLAEGRYADAESLARQIVNGDPGNYYAKLRLAAALRLQAKYDDAEGVVRQMLAAYPADTSFMNELGLLSVAQNKKVEAKQWFSAVLMLNPANVVAVEQSRGL